MEQALQGFVLLLWSAFTVHTPARYEPAPRYGYAVHDAPLSCALAGVKPQTRYEVHLLMRGADAYTNAVELVVDGYPLTTTPGTGIIPRGYNRWAFADRYTSGEVAAFTAESATATVCIAHTEPGAEVMAALLIPAAL